MAQRASQTYGVRLDGLVVIDCDTWNDETQKLVAESFGDTPFKVKTSRGMHLYFRSGDPVPKGIKSSSIQIDFKHGHNHFVVGPGSVRPDGKAYRIVDSAALISELPVFRHDIRLPSEAEAERVVISFKGSIEPGGRNDALVSRAVALAKNASSQLELETSLLEYARAHLATWENFSPSQVPSIASWAWDKRKANKLYGRENSEFRLGRQAMDLVRKLPSKRVPDAWFLYSLLVSVHGHEPGKVFAIAIDSMVTKSHLPFGKSTGYVARENLLSLGLISRVQSGKFGKADKFRLVNPALLAA